MEIAQNGQYSPELSTNDETSAQTEYRNPGVNIDRRWEFLEVWDCENETTRPKIFWVNKTHDFDVKSLSILLDAVDLSGFDGKIAQIMRTHSLWNLRRRTWYFSTRW